MKLVIARYSIEYNNGVKQQKNLIRHDDFINLVVPLRTAADHFKSIKNEQKEREAKQELKSLIGSDDFFTDGSGLFEASITGILKLPPHMGGDSACMVTKIN